MRSNKLLKGFAVAAAALTMMAGCDTDVVYDRYEHTPTEGWDKSDTLFFDVPRLTESGRYRMEIGLRTNAEFPFTDLTLVVDRTVEPGHQLKSDTLKCRVADDKGNILGQGISYFQYSFILADADLHRGDSLHISVRHIMKREIIPGISDVGLKLTSR